MSGVSDQDIDSMCYTLPKISVVTAAYNSAQTILATLDSLNQQTYPVVEHVIVDGLSTDNTLDIVRRHGIEGIIIDSQRDLGIYDALNRGVQLASGDVVGFLHSDDFFAGPDVLATIAEVFRDPLVSMCYGDLVYVSGNDLSRVIRRWKSSKFRRSRLKFGWMPPHPTVYVRRELLLSYPFKLDYKISGDYDALLRLLLWESIKAVYIPRELVHMRLGGASNKSVSNIWTKTTEDWRAIRSNHVGGIATLISKNVRKFAQFFV